MTEIKDDGGPAFPNGVKPIDALEASRMQDGMTLRDWFAGQALAGVLANNSPLTDVAGNVSLRTPELVAKIAYQLAAAMIKARRP